ncbi:MAG: hypothetical protein IH945_10985, partial [Armatimonadetes bacterium]|nr:hypothetical protein [Armatimonadota bacterium]
MSDRMAFWDFNTEVESWMHAFPVADPMQRKEYYYQFKKALKVMQYFEVMQGRPFLGPFEGSQRDYVYAARDRVDEVFDTARCVRNDRYL